MKIGPFILLEYDLDALLNKPLDTTSVRYVNAKVVLVGDSGVGKSGLWLCSSQAMTLLLPNQHMVASYGRSIVMKLTLKMAAKETREVLLWDLAGQAGYRLIHQLYLNEVAVALILFDSRSETDPFAGLYYHWDRALRLAQRNRMGSGRVSPMQKAEWEDFDVTEDQKASTEEQEARRTVLIAMVEDLLLS